MSILSAVLSCAFAVVTAKAPVGLPIPQQQAATPGTFTVTEQTRVVADPMLKSTATLLAEELAVVRHEGAARPGDIELRLGEVGHGPEAYQLTVGDTVVLKANTETGVFYATRTLNQWLRQTRTIPRGTTTDWPKYPERGLLVDIGRKYFTIPWLRDRIREMSAVKLNMLHLHLSDRQGFRLASDTHPEVVSAQHYTKQEIRELVDYAARYHVQLVPEIDFPGHMDAILAAHPELQLPGQPGAIDLAKPESYDLMRDLMTEFLPLFPGQYWHIGADEYVTGHERRYYEFINWANGIVRAAGKTTRMFNDGLKPGARIDPNIIVEYWSANGPGGLPWVGPALTPKQLAEAGHRLQNMAFTPTYFTTGGPGSLFNQPPAVMYDLWNPDVFIDGSRLPGQLGAKVSVWCDEPDKMTEAQIADALANRLKVLAQLTWGSPKPLLYVLFLPVMTAVG